MDQIGPCIPLLAKMIYTDDVETLMDALWALAYFTTDGGGPQIQVRARGAYEYRRSNNSSLRVNSPKQE